MFPIYERWEDRCQPRVTDYVAKKSPRAIWELNGSDHQQSCDRLSALMPLAKDIIVRKGFQFYNRVFWTSWKSYRRPELLGGNELVWSTVLEYTRLVQTYKL